ncbi:hypothetical protein LTR97_005821 [Elasticomyces elasticus]|uniref:F-box domain-containing protein n=1 Tax=Elasticomyces elasticus TaxID=574655 RepID=A0AAN8A1A0_9PEZI|nr:hypothetical protein LTR97_005821 [Elasticomyces elasticus]
MALAGAPALSYPPLTYPERLRTFEGHWDDNEATARQLAAIGHISDRPGIESLEEGSRCGYCSQFVQRDWSVRALEGALGSAHDYRGRFEGFRFHHAGCIHLQVRIPLEAQAVFPGLYGGHSVSETRDRWERMSSHARPKLEQDPTVSREQTASLFTLPTELRLQIYELILPVLDDTIEVMTLNSDSSRIATRAGVEKSGPRDLTKTNILRTCHYIHNEALDLLYRHRTYRFASCKVLYLFLRHIGSPGRSLSTSIDVIIGGREDAITLSLLAVCVKLKSITLSFSRATISQPRPPPWVTDGMAALLELRGLDTVHFAKGVQFFHVGHGPYVPQDGDISASVVRKELMRPRGEEGGVRWVGAYLDL